MNRENGFVNIPTPPPPHIDADQWYAMLAQLAGRAVTRLERQTASRLAMRGHTLLPIARQLFGGRAVDARMAAGVLAR